jgi:hypothetical protein
MIEYTLGEWIDDFSDLMQALQENESLAIGMNWLNVEWDKKHFADKYANHGAAERRRLRFVKAMTWLELHDEDLNFPGSSVAASKQRLVTRDLVKSLWRIFSNIPDNQLNVDPPLELVISVVKETIAANPNPLP